MRLTITLPTERTKLGSATLGGTVFACLGKSDNQTAAAHNNPTRNPLLPFGDTPLGTYIGTVVPAGADTAGYGPNKRILLTPVSGDCVKAEKNGREGLMCHGGDPNPEYTQWGGLRPTFGCVRLSNADMGTVLAAILGAERLDVVIQAQASQIN